MKKTATLINRLINIVILLVFMLLANQVHAQQGGNVTYGYDANGRLTSVTLPTGEAVTYSYDPAGNITAIQRVTGPGPQFLSFNPQMGFVGDTVTFNGANFGTVTSISFNGTSAQATSANMTQITTTVPASASSGPITVTLSNGMFVTSNFTVLALQVTPSQASILPAQTQQFTAVVPSQLGNNAVTWSVNNVVGGNATVGTISSSGFYIAPNVTSTQTFTIKATSVARPTLSAQATITVNPNLFLFQARDSVLIQYKPESKINQANVALLSVLKGVFSSRSQLFQATSSPVLVLKGVFSSSLQTFHTQSSPVSVDTAPVITSITPNSLTRNTTTSVTIAGLNLTATSSLVFINDSNGQIDTNITISNITVAPDGNSLTVSITVSNGASTGNRVVVISQASTGHSTTSNNSTNIISILP